MRIHRRNLKYDTGSDGKWSSAREKGIDVAFAANLVETSLHESYDAAVV